MIFKSISQRERKMLHRIKRLFPLWDTYSLEYVYPNSCRTVALRNVFVDSLSTKIFLETYSSAATIQHIEKQFHYENYLWNLDRYFILLWCAFVGCTTGYFGLFLCVGAGAFGQSSAGNGVRLITRIDCKSTQWISKTLHVQLSCDIFLCSLISFYLGCPVRT